MGFATSEEVKAYTPRAESVSASKLKALVEDASDWIRSVAPEPAELSEEPSADYSARAKRATLRVTDYFIEAGNLTSKGSVGGDTPSKSFADPDRIERLIRPVMGSFVSGGSGNAVAYVGTAPFLRG